METQEYLQQAVSSFLDRFRPEHANDITILRDIQAAFAAGEGLDTQYPRFAAIGDAELLTALYEHIPNPSQDGIQSAMIGNPRCPASILEKIKSPNTQVHTGSDVISKHPLLTLNETIELDLQGLTDYEAMLPAGEISGPDKAGCEGRINNLRRLFDRVPRTLHETDLTDNTNVLLPDLIAAKQRIEYNQRLFNRICIGITNRFSKSELEQTDDDPERAIPEAAPNESSEQEEIPTPESEGPSEAELAEAELAELQAEADARAEAEAIAAKKAAEKQRQRRLRMEGKEREDRTHKEQQKLQEEASRKAELQQSPYSSYGTQEEYLNRQAALRDEEQRIELERSHAETRARQDEDLRQYEERMARSRDYESFGKSHIDFSGAGQHGSTELYPDAPTTDYTAPVPQVEPGTQSSTSDRLTDVNAAGQRDQYSYGQERADDAPTPPAYEPQGISREQDTPSAATPVYPSGEPPHSSQTDYGDRDATLQRQQEYRHDSLRQEDTAQETAIPDSQNGVVQQYEERIDHSRDSESFGNGYIGSSGSGQHDNAELYPGAPATDYTAPVPPVDPSPQSSTYDRTAAIDAEQGGQHSVSPQYDQGRTDDTSTAPVYEQQGSSLVQDTPSAAMPVYPSEEPPHSSQTDYDDRDAVLRKQQEYRDDSRRQEAEAREAAVRARRDDAERQYEERMARSRDYVSFGNGHIDFSGDGHHGSTELYPGAPATDYTAPVSQAEPGAQSSAPHRTGEFQPYSFTPGGGVAPMYNPDSVYGNNQELLQTATNNSRITPEISRAMYANLEEARQNYELAKGTPEAAAAELNYKEARAAFASAGQAVRNQDLDYDSGATAASNPFNVSKAYHNSPTDAFTAYQFTPSGVQGESFSGGVSTGAVTIHNAPGTVGKDVLSKEHPMLVTQAYEDTLFRSAQYAKEQMEQLPQKPNFSTAELMSYKTCLDAYEGYTHAKSEGYVRVSSESGAASVPDQRAWAARQETYRNSRDTQTSANTNNRDDTSPIPIDIRNPNNRNHRNDRSDGDPVPTDPRNRNERNDHRDRNDRSDRNDGGPTPFDPHNRNNNHNDRRERNNHNDGSPIPPDPHNRNGVKADVDSHSRNGGQSNNVAPFGSIFSVRYNRGKYTAGEKESSADLLNRTPKLSRPGALRTFGTRSFQNFSYYAPNAGMAAARKLYNMAQAGNDSSTQSIRTFEQARYYGAVGTGIVLAATQRSIGSVDRYASKAEKIERHNFGFTRQMSDKEISKTLHTRINEGRAAKKEIRQMYDTGTELSADGRRVLAQKIKDHKATGAQTAKWAGLQQARLKEKLQKEVLEDLHRNVKGQGLVTDKAIKDLENHRKEIQHQRRQILKSQTERVDINKRISELQKKGKGALTEAEKLELADLRKKLSQLSSDSRLKALDLQEKELSKRIKASPDETAVKLKNIRLKDLEKYRTNVLSDFDKIEKTQFGKFYGVKTSVIKKNKALLERQSEVAKRQVALLSKKSRLTAEESAQLQRLVQKLKKNQSDIKAHSDLLNLRHKRDLKIDILDKNRKALLKRKQRLRMGKMALISFMMKPLQEGDAIGAHGLAKGISFGMNPTLHRIIRGTLSVTYRYAAFAVKKIGKATGLDKAAAPVAKKAKAVGESVRKAANTPKELQKRAVKTAKTAVKREAEKLTPQFVKTGASLARSKLASVAARLQQSKLGKAYEAVARAAAKFKAAVGTIGKAAFGVIAKVILGLLLFVLLIGIVSTVVTSMGGSVPSVVIMGDDSSEDGKIDLTPYAEVYNEKLDTFKEEIVAKKTAKEYTVVTEHCYGPTDYNNIKEVLSMMAVRMNQDLDMNKNAQVKKYIKSLFDDSHIIYTEESDPYSCAGCKKRWESTPHTDSCPKDCTEEHHTDECPEDCTEAHHTDDCPKACTDPHLVLVDYCPGDHIDLTIKITTLTFDEIFTADSMGNEDQEVQQGGLIASDFEITYYLPTGNNTASGTVPTAGRTIAVDPSVIPLGTHVIINGHEYVAEDTGGAVQGHIIDIFVDDEDDIPAAGRLYNVAVYLADYVGDGVQVSGEWNGWVQENREFAKNLYTAPWDDLYDGIDAVGAYVGSMEDYDWESFEYSDEENLTQAQQRVAHIAKNSSTFGIPAQAGYCQQWVRLVYSEAGFPGGSAASANDAGSQWLVSSEWADIPVGAAVYGYSSSVYGHVGIYVGGGQVYHNVGGVAIDSLESWVAKYNGYGWGWQGGHDLSSAS